MTQQKQAQETPVDLDDIRAMYQFCFMFVEHIMEQQVMVCESKLSPEDAAAENTQMVAWFSATMGGDNPQVATRSKSTSKQTDDRLRLRFAQELAALPPQDARHFDAPGHASFFACLQFLSDVHRTLEDLRWHADEKTEGDARQVHDLCVKWAEIFTNQKFPLVV